MKEKEEFIDIVDENDNFVRKVSRKISYEENLRHRVSRVIIVNSKKEFLICKRASNKKKYPLYWDLGIAETLSAGESYESAAVRGLLEELGIKSSKFKLHFLYKSKYDGEQTKKYYAAYSLVYEDKIKPDLKEVSEAKFVSEPALAKMIKKEKFVPAGLMIYKEYKKIHGGKM